MGTAVLHAVEQPDGNQSRMGGGPALLLIDSPGIGSAAIDGGMNPGT
jgi:hypothetical protein